HFMVENPIESIEQWAAAGFKRFIGQIEHMENQQAFVEKAKQYGEAGVAIDGPTSIEDLDLETSPDCILVMTIRAGFSGQEFQEQQLEKIRFVRKNFDCPIEVDGGINSETLL